MVSKTERVKVTVKRFQDSEPWSGETVSQHFLDIYDKKGEIVGTGEQVGILVRDERGFEMFAQPDQMELVL